MAVVSFYVLLEPTYSKDGKTLHNVKAAKMVQGKPAPSTAGLWVNIQIEVSDAVFQHLIPKFVAQLEMDQIQKFLEQTSPLYMSIVGLDDPLGPPGDPGLFE